MRLSKAFAPLKSLDYFARDVGFHIRGKAHFGTYCGACTSILLLIIMLFYMQQKFQVLVNNGDTLHVTYIDHNALDQDEIFTYNKTNFMFAMGMVPNKNEKESVLVTPSEKSDYVQFKVTKTFKSQNSSPVEVRLPLHQCTRDDFDLMHTPQARFMRAIIDERYSGYMCLDNPEDLTLQGFEGQTSQDVQISIERCKDKSTCKSESEIDEFLAFQKFAWIYNSAEYLPMSYGDESIRYGVTQEFVNINSTKSYRLTKHNLESENDFIGFGMNTQDVEFFDVSFHHDMPPATGDTLLTVQILLERDVVHYKRSIYSTLDFLGDLGGLYDALLVLGYVMIFLFKIIVGNELEDYLLKVLFTRKYKRDPSTTDK